MLLLACHALIPPFDAALFADTGWEHIEHTIGISTDEFTRAKDSDVKYLRNVFPLIELGWDR